MYTLMNTTTRNNFNNYSVDTAMLNELNGFMYETAIISPDHRVVIVNRTKDHAKAMLFHSNTSAILAILTEAEAFEYFADCVREFGE